ncbi:MAG: GTP cyclohydrolase I, partial [Acidobacteria bacterium]|nr:GTP cyclohydrolase I [Candidatus Sulfomarinibacter sp. MAG AM2]
MPCVGIRYAVARLSVSEGVCPMRDVATLDSQSDESSSAGTTNGDNSIRRGEEERIITAVAEHMAAVMRELNLDLEDPNFTETPERVAKMYLEMFHGLREGAEPKITTFPNDE